MTDRTISGTQERSLRFVIVGAGMSGILGAIKLEEAGYHDVTIYEKADRLGGTWRENTYPGIACDVPSHLYCYSFEPNAHWSHRFSPGVIAGTWTIAASRHRGRGAWIGSGRPWRGPGLPHTNWAETRGPEIHARI